MVNRPQWRGVDPSYPRKWAAPAPELSRVLLMASVFGPAFGVADASNPRCSQVASSFDPAAFTVRMRGDHKTEPLAIA